MSAKAWFMAALAALAVGSLAGCGAGTGKAAAPTVITYWAHQNEGWNVSHKAIAERYMAKNPNVKVELQFFPYDDFQSKVQTSLLAKSGGADVYELWGGWAIDFVPTGKFAKVPDSFVKELKKDYFAPALGSFVYKGDYYGVPIEFNIESGGLLVNKKLFTEKGLAYPTTWAEMLSVADKSSKRTGALMSMRGFDFVTFDNVTYTWLSMLMSKGASYRGADGTFNFTSPEAVDAMTQLIHYVVDKGYTNLEAITGGGNEGHYFLFEDQSMMVARGPWVISEGITTYKLKLGVDFDYIAMPWYGEKKAFAAETGWGLSVSQDSPVKEAAWKYVSFFMQPENIVGHLEACGMLPARQSIADSAEYRKRMPFVVPLLEILKYGQYIGNFNTDVFKEGINAMFVRLCTTKDFPTVKDGLAELQRDLNAKIFK
jgi:multiple sugar transport system substrate-binding protein